MRLTIVKDEQSVGALADRLYPKLTAAARRQVEAAVLKANPQLAHAEALRPGMVVHLPDIPDLKPKAEAGPDPSTDLLDGLKEAVDGYRERLEKGLAAAEDDLRSQERLPKQREVAAAIKATPGAPELAKSLAGALADRRKAIADTAKQLDTTFKQIAKDLESIR